MPVLAVPFWIPAYAGMTVESGGAGGFYMRQPGPLTLKSAAPTYPIPARTGRNSCTKAGRYSRQSPTIP